MSGFGGVEIKTVRRIREFITAEEEGDSSVESFIQDEIAPPDERRARRKDPEKKPYGALGGMEKNAWERMNRAAAKRRRRQTWDPRDEVYAFRVWSQRQNNIDRLLAQKEGRHPPAVPTPRYVRHVVAVLTSDNNRILVRNPYSLKKRNKRSASREDAWEGLFRTRLHSFEEPDEVARARIGFVLSGTEWEWVGSVRGIVSPEAGVEYTFIFGRCHETEPVWGWRWRRPDELELAPDQWDALARAAILLPSGVLTPTLWRATVVE